MAKMDNPLSVEHNRNEDAMRLRWAQMEKMTNLAAQGGGAKRIAKEHAKGKLTARERLIQLSIRTPLLWKSADWLEKGCMKNMAVAPVVV